LLSPEEIEILNKIPSSDSSKHKQTKLHIKKRQRQYKLNEQKQSSSEEEEQSNESS
jgi:hypothetical protein